MSERLGAPFDTRDEAVAFVSAVYMVAITVCASPGCNQPVVRLNHTSGGACPVCGAELPPPLRVFSEVATA